VLEPAGLDDRNELQVSRADFASQEAVYVERARSVASVHAGQRIEPHAEATQKPGRREHRVERRRAALGHPILVVQLPGAVDAEADQESMLLEEARPILVEQRAVRLQVVLDSLAGLGMLLLQRDDLAEKVQSPQRRLTALP